MYVVQKQAAQFPLRCLVFGLCLVGVALLVLLGCCLFCLPLFFVSAWWNRGIAEEVTMASYSKAVTGTAVMARSANGEKKKKAFGLTYTLPLPPSFLQKMMMNCWMQHRTSTCLSPPQLAALSRIWNKLLMTCTLPPLNRYLLIPFFISPFPVCPSHTHGLSSPLTSKTSSLSWIEHVLTHLVAAQASVNPRFQHPAPVAISHLLSRFPFFAYCAH